MVPTQKRTFPVWPALLVLAAVALVLTMSFGLAVAGDEPAKDEVVGSIKWTKPAGWVTEKPSSGMRKAQYKLPKAEGDAEDGELVVYHFGGRSGGVEANIDRWVGQFEGDGGKAMTRSDATIAKKKVGGLDVTTVDLTGRYVAAVSPGAAAKHDKPDFRMLAAIVTTPEGNYFFKLLGPKKTIAHWEKSFGELIESLKGSS